MCHKIHKVIIITLYSVFLRFTSTPGHKYSTATVCLVSFLFFYTFIINGTHMNEYCLFSRSIKYIKLRFYFV